MNGQPRGILVSDFDGTMTRHDFYKLVIESLLPRGTPDYWAQYRAGTMTHFEALRRYFAAIRAPEAEVLAVVERMDLDPGLPAAVAAWKGPGGRWSSPRPGVTGTSAGCWGLPGSRSRSSPTPGGSSRSKGC